MAFRQRLEGLLAGGNPMFDVGVGLLSGGGDHFGQDLGHALQFASERQRAAAQNALFRQRMEQESQQRDAHQQLVGLLGGSDDSNQQMLGLLAQANPNAFSQTAIQGLLGPQQERSDPADLRMMDAIGLPRTPEGFAQFQGLKADDGNKGMLDALNLQIQGLQLANMKREQEREDQQIRETRLTRENSIRRGLEQTQKIADLTLELEGTALSAGLPASEWRRRGLGAISAVGGALGLDVEDLNKNLTAFDELKKGLNDQLITLMSAGSLGQATDSKLQQYRDSLASPDTQPGAVMEIQAGIAETLLDQADVLRFDLPNRDEIEASIQRMRGYQQPGTETVFDVPAAAGATRRSVVRAADIGRMSLEKIRSLDVDALTQEQRDALARRLDELGL